MSYIPIRYHVHLLVRYTVRRLLKLKRKQMKRLMLLMICTVMSLTLFGQHTDTNMVVIPYDVYQIMTSCPVRLEGCEEKLSVKEDEINSLNNSLVISHQTIDDLEGDNSRLKRKLRRLPLFTFFIGIGIGVPIGLKL